MIHVLAAAERSIKSVVSENEAVTAQSKGFCFLLMASSPSANPAIGTVPASAICERDCGPEYLICQEFGSELSPGHGTNSVPILRHEDNLQHVVAESATSGKAGGLNDEPPKAD